MTGSHAVEAVSPAPARDARSGSGPARRARKPVQGVARAVVLTSIFFGAPPVLEIGHLLGGTEKTRQWFATVARLMARTFQLDLVLEGELPVEAREVRVVNHTSYLDIFLLSGIRGGRFLAMKDVASWFMVGRVAKRVGCIFLDRSSKHDRAAAVRTLTDAAKTGSTPLIVFPEGGTGMGPTLKPFQPGAFVVAKRAGVPIRPIAIVYDDLAEIGWIDDMPLGTHVWKRLAGPLVRARVIPLPLVAVGADEAPEAVAERVRAMIEQAARPPGA
jgi:1-acyl-sn-glycerol-3-phosphate acyltransferase